MKRIVLTRTGQARLHFLGELMAENMGQHQGGKDRNRWHNLAVYRMEGGRYVVAIAYRTRWQGELDRDLAFPVDTAADVAALLSGHNCTAYVGGYPDGEAYRERQERLLADIRRRYESQVSDVLASDEFAEGVP